MASNVRYQPLVAVSENLGGKVPVKDNVLSSHEQDSYLNTSLNENCIKFESQTNRKYSVDLRQTYFDVKLRFVKGFGYRKNNTTDVKNEHKEDIKADVETDE